MTEPARVVEVIDGDGTDFMSRAVARGALGEFGDHPSAILGNVAQRGFPLSVTGETGDEYAVGCPAEALRDGSAEHADALEAIDIDQGFDRRPFGAGTRLELAEAAARALKTGAELLFEVLSHRYERGSTIVTSNLPSEDRTQVLGSERLAGALRA